MKQEQLRKSKIVSIKPLKGHNEPRYNLEVENTHNYIANNIVVHNCRCVAKLVGGKVKLFSRKNKEFTSLTHISKELRDFFKDNPKKILDGELYSHSLTFQEMTSFIRREEFKEDCKQIKYMVYDLVSNDDFSVRSKELRELIKKSGVYNTRLVQTKECTSEEVAVLQHKKAVEDGYEGIMLRNKKGPYKINGRSKDLQKYKSFQDAEYKIIDVIEGKGKFVGCGIFVCTCEHGDFKVTPKRTHEEKKKIWKEKKKYIGQMLTVEFFEFTDKKIPRFPIGKDIRCDYN